MRTKRKRQLKFFVICLIVWGALFLNSKAQSAKIYNVKDPTFGARGDGKTLDTMAINKAIETASREAVVGQPNIVLFPAGDYLSVSIHLRSNVTLYLARDATIIAAQPSENVTYDSPEPNQWDQYQDFGHSHWQNSLIWGENLENISIIGPGLIWGKGLVRSGNQSRTREQNESLRSAKMGEQFGYPNPRDAVEPGWANKSISLKNCRNVVIRDISILHGGHFAILATGIDSLIIDSVTIDTNRDGIDIDASGYVLIVNTKVNSPFDDAIALKSSLALGIVRTTRNVLITKTRVSGYDEGTMLDGTLKRDYQHSNPSGPTGRIKIGTESNGGFWNIKITDNEFKYCRGLAIEMVDGGILQDVVIENTQMTDVTNSPIFIRLGDRRRGPKETTPVGKLQNVRISNLTATNADSRYGSIISGIPHYVIEGLILENINIQYKGGGTREQAMIEPPEKETEYPEPSMFGETPAYGFFVRHAKGITVNEIQISYIKADLRPPFWLSDVKDVDFKKITAQHGLNIPSFVLKDTADFSLQQSPPLADTRFAKVKQEKF